MATIGIIQVAQPAIAVCWSFLILGEPIEPAQVPGMVLVIVGLVAFTIDQAAPVGRPRPLPWTPTNTGSSRDQRAERAARRRRPENLIRVMPAEESRP